MKSYENELSLLRSRGSSAFTAANEPVQGSIKQGRSCLFLNTYYDRFLANFYGKAPSLLSAPYQQQKSLLQAEGFGDSDFYSAGLEQAGWQADDLVINSNPLQTAWAQENGFKGEGFAIAVEQIRRARPDVIYIQDMHCTSREFLDAVRPHVSLIVGQIASPVANEIPFEKYDLVFSCVPYYVERLRASGVTAYYQPLAFAPRVLDNVPLKTWPGRSIPCSFAGGISNYHVGSYALLDLLVRNTPLQVWGYGVETLAEDSPIRDRHRGEAWGRDMLAILADSKITINRHGEVAENFACNMRLFEATGSGTLLITDHKDNLNELFEIGREVVAYRSPAECAALVSYYLAHPDEAEAIARAGQERTFRDHTYARRMEQTAEILERHLRYRREKNRYAPTDMATVSYGHTTIRQDDVSEAMTTAWQDAGIPAKQRAMVQQALDAMYRGEKLEAYQVLADIMRPHVHLGSSVLELGCSSGYCYEILEYLLKKRLDYTGVDYSEPMVAMAKDYYPHASFFAADGASLFFADRSFHTVISSCVLLHVPNWRQHVFETVRVAGRFVVASRTPVCRTRPTQYLKKYAYGVETVELIFNEGEIVREFLLNGLRLVDMIEYHTDPANDEYQVTYLFKRP